MVKGTETKNIPMKIDTIGCDLCNKTIRKEDGYGIIDTYNDGNIQITVSANQNLCKHFTIEEICSSCGAEKFNEVVSLLEKLGFKSH
jgi:adenylate cyclase class IV